MTGAEDADTTGTAVVGGSTNVVRSRFALASCASQPPTPPAASVPAIRRKPDFSMIMGKTPVQLAPNGARLPARSSTLHARMENAETGHYMQLDGRRSVSDLHTPHDCLI